MPEEASKVVTTISWPKVILTVLIIVVVAGAISGGLFWYLVLRQPTESTPSITKVATSSSKTATPSAQKDETAGWKTYTGKTNSIKFSLKYPPTFFDTGFAWTSSPGPDPEAAGFDNVEGQQPGSTAQLVDGEIRLAIKANLTKQLGIQRVIEEPMVSSSLGGVKALKYSGRDPAFGGSNLPSNLGRVMYYVNDQDPVDAQHHFIFECMFNPYSNSSLQKMCEIIATTFKFLPSQ